MVEVLPDAHVEDQFMVQGDIPAFRSPLDGTIVEGRKQYVEHMRKHNVVPHEAQREVRPAGFAGRTPSPGIFGKKSTG